MDAIAIGSGSRLATLRDASRQVLYVGLSLAILAGSLALLVFTSAAHLAGMPLAAALIGEGIGFAIGLYCSVVNVRAALGDRMGGPLLGLGAEIDPIASQALLTLVTSADQAYQDEAPELDANILSPAGHLRRLRELALSLVLAGGAALIALRRPHASYRDILPWSLLAFFAPYVVAVLYQFFCSTIERYAFRCAAVREALQAAGAGYPLGQGINPPATGGGLLLSVRSLWVRFTLRFPLVAAIIQLFLGRGVFVALGLSLSMAALPFLDAWLASTSLADISLQLCAAAGWAWGYEQSLRVLSLVSEWRLLHTIGDLITVAIVSYTLVLASVPDQAARWGAKWLPLIVVIAITAPVGFLSALAYTIVWLLSLGKLPISWLDEIVSANLARFWGGIIHLWIVYATFAALLVFGQRLMAQAW